MEQVLKDLLANFYSRPIMTMAAILIALTAFISYKSYDRLEALFLTPQQEATRFHQSLEAMDLVNKSLDNLKTNTSASTAIIYQFHNGKHDLTGIPFTSALVTFSTDGYASDLPISTMNSSLRAMWTRIDKPSCVALDAPVDIESQKLFTKYKLKTLVMCPLINPLSYPIGVLSVGYVTPIKETSEPSKIATSIVGYITDYDKLANY